MSEKQYVLVFYTCNRCEPIVYDFGSKEKFLQLFKDEGAILYHDKYHTDDNVWSFPQSSKEKLRLYGHHHITHKVCYCDLYAALWEKVENETLNDIHEEIKCTYIV